MRMLIVALLLATTACLSDSDICARDCSGCCDTQGHCHHGDEATACGPVGKLCITCGAGESCGLFRTCYTACGPMNCAGCCTSGDTCRPGTEGSECGTAGAACDFCSFTQTCTAGRCQP